MNDEIVTVALGEDLENIHRALKMNSLIRVNLKGKPMPSYNLLCVKCGKTKEVLIANATQLYQCC
jgi:hypothetical protein